MASTNVGSIHYDLELNTKDFDKKVSSISSTLNNVGQKMSSIGQTMTIGLTLPIVAGMGFAVKAFSDLGEAVNAANVTFGKSGKILTDFAETAAQSVGLSKRAFLEASVPLGAALQNVGMSSEDAANKTIMLTQRASDMASVFNVDVSEALTAIGAGLRGETEPLKRFGASLDEASVKAYAVKIGLIGSSDEMTQQQKVVARLGLFMEQTSRTQGDFANTANQLANKTRITKAEFENMSATFGEKLYPAGLRIMGVLAGIIEKFNALSPAQQDLILKLALIVAAVGPVLLVFGKLTSAISGLIPLLANPAFWAITAVLLAIAGAAFLVYKNWDQISPIVERVRQKIVEVWNTMKPLAEFMMNQLSNAFQDMTNAWNRSLVALKPFKEELAIFGKLLGVGLVALIVAPTIAFGALITVIARFIGWVGLAASWVLDKLKPAFELLKPATDAVGWAMDSVGQALIFLGLTSDNTKGAVDRNKDAHNGLKLAMQEAKNASDQLRDAQLGLEGSNLAVERAQRTYNEAVRNYGPSSLEAREALYGLKTAQDSQKDASDRAKSATDQHKSAIDTLNNQEQAQKSLRGTAQATRESGQEFDNQRSKPLSFSNTVLVAFGNLPGFLKSVGINMIGGLITGMGSMFGPLIATATSIVNSVVSKFREMLKIKSPSQVFYGFGENIVKGLIEGINNTKVEATATIESMASSVTQQPTLSPSSTTIYGNVNIGQNDISSDALAVSNRNQTLLAMGLAPGGGL